MKALFSWLRTIRMPKALLVRQQTVECFNCVLLLDFPQNSFTRVMLAGHWQLMLLHGDEVHSGSCSKKYSS